MSLLWKVVIGLNTSFLQATCCSFPLLSPTHFFLRLMLKSIKPEGSLLSTKLASQHCALLLMLVLLAPFSPWQQPGHFSKPCNFTSSTQWKHLQISSKMHPHWVYISKCKYSELLVEFSVWYPDKVLYSGVHGEPFAFCGQDDRRFSREEESCFLILMFPEAYLGSWSIHVLGADKERAGSSTRSDSLMLSRVCEGMGCCRFYGLMWVLSFFHLFLGFFGSVITFFYEGLGFSEAHHLLGGKL